MLATAASVVVVVVCRAQKDTSSFRFRFIAKLGAIFRWSFVNCAECQCANKNPVYEMCVRTKCLHQCERKRASCKNTIKYCCASEKQQQQKHKVEQTSKLNASSPILYTIVHITTTGERINKISPSNLVLASPTRVRVCKCRKRKNVVMVIIRLVLLLKYTGILKLLSSLSSDECRCCLTATPFLCLLLLPFAVVVATLYGDTHACSRHHHHHKHYFELDSASSEYIFIFWLPLKIVCGNIASHLLESRWINHVGACQNFQIGWL